MMSVEAGKAASPDRARPLGTRSSRMSGSSELTERQFEPTLAKEARYQVRRRDGLAMAEARCPDTPREDGRRSRSVRIIQAKRRVRARVAFHVLPPPQVGRTPGISCEAVPAPNRGVAGMRRHLNESRAGLP